MHPFEGIREGQLESLSRLLMRFADDPVQHKVDLMCGVFKTETGGPFVLPSVRKAKNIIFDDPAWDHEYPPSHLGEKPFRDLSTRLLFGEGSSIIREGRLASMQTVGGSGACHMGAAFLRRHYPSEQSNNHKPPTVYMPVESWVNCPNVFQYEGFVTQFLPYYNPSTRTADARSFIEAIDDLPLNSIVVLQVCGNNPSGCDLSPSEWVTLAETFKARSHFAFFDAPYMGFVSGDVERDCEPVRLFADLGIPFLVAATYGKAFGLYGERVGHLCIDAPDSKTAARMEDQMKLLARAETGAMPRFGARIVTTILQDDALREAWKDDVRYIAMQLNERRLKLQRALRELNTPGDWTYVTQQKGMFLYTGFTTDQINILRETYHVYLQDTGRVSIAGLNPENLTHVAESIDATIRETTK